MVVDPLRGLVELGRHLGARPGFGELPQHFDPLRLEQGLRLLDPIQVHDVSHEKISFYVKEVFVNAHEETAGGRVDRWAAMDGSSGPVQVQMELAPIVHEMTGDSRRCLVRGSPGGWAAIS